MRSCEGVFLDRVCSWCLGLTCFKLSGQAFELNDINGSNFFLVFIITCDHSKAYMVLVVVDNVPEGLARSS